MLSLDELHLRAALFRAVRAFFHDRGFLEVDTPVRQPVIIPESTIIPLAAEDWFLQTSPELYMKRLLASGCERIFQLCPCFRKEERGRLHHEEFTMLEWYRRDADYRTLMDDCEQLVGYTVTELASLAKTQGRNSRDIGTVSAIPWRRITVAEAFERWSPVALDDALAQGVYEEMLVDHVEPPLGDWGPVFLCDYPASLASLARRKKDDPRVAERFEFYLDGVELANGFSELADPVEQRQRFTEELSRMKEQGRAVMEMPERFLRELAGIGQAAGIALGLDRLFMQILGKKELSAVVTFAPDEL